MMFLPSILLAIILTAYKMINTLVFPCCVLCMIFIELLRELINMPDLLKLTRVVTGGTVLTLLCEQAKK